MTPHDQLEAIHARVAELMEKGRVLLHDDLLPQLAANEVKLIDVDSLTGEEWKTIDALASQT